MSKLESLQTCADQAARRRGHDELKWDAVEFGADKSRCSRHGVCQTCGMGVQIHTHPRANEIELSGKAVAMTCRSEATVKEPTTLVYRAIAGAFIALRNAERANNEEWIGKHTERINRLVDENLPTGSGFDSGTQFSYNTSHRGRLVFHTSFHHMDEGGSYDGWTDHPVSVTPDLFFGINVKVGGRDRNDIKDYIGEVFGDALETEIPMYPAKEE